MTMTERFITSTLNRRDPARESTLRPPSFAEFPGQDRAKAQLELFVRAARERTDLPLAVYNVSGEYAMVKAAAERGWLDERRVVGEILTAFFRAGADLVITYHALDYAAWEREA